MVDDYTVRDATGIFGPKFEPDSLILYPIHDKRCKVCNSRNRGTYMDLRFDRGFTLEALSKHAKEKFNEDISAGSFSRHFRHCNKTPKQRRNELIDKKIAARAEFVKHGRIEEDMTV
jgi:hypothetical protein